MTTSTYPRAHTNDPAASHEAAAALNENTVSALKAAIIHLLKIKPMTAYELSGAYQAARLDHGWPLLTDPHNISRRITELREAGRVVDTGRKGPSRYRTGTVWGLAE